MNNDFITTAVGGIVCLALSATGIFYILSPVQDRVQQGAQERMDSRSVGPLDNVIADKAGVERRPKSQSPLPKRKSVNFGFESGF